MTDDVLKAYRRSPIVDRYVTTDMPLLEILDMSGSVEDDLILKALHAVHACLARRQLAKDAIELARRVSAPGADPELLVLLLSGWAELSCRIGRPNEAQTLVRRAQALLNDRTHPEVRARATLVESMLSDATGNRARQETLLRRTLDELPPHSPRRKFYAWELVFFLARQGRGVEAQEDLRELTWQCNERFHLHRITFVQFVNAVETGAIQQASQWRSQLQTSTEPDADFVPPPYRAYPSLLRIMHACAHRTAALPPAPSEPPASPDPPWIRVVNCLLQRDTSEALRLAREEAGKLMGSLFGTGFASLSLVRAELAAGKSQGARHLIGMRQARGNRHYLDDFFLARAALLDEKPRRAARHFAEALRQIERYQARGRLDFELQLAVELSHGDIVELTRAAEHTGRRSAAARPAPAAPGSADDDPGTEDATQDRKTIPAAQRGAQAVRTVIGRGKIARGLRDTILKYAAMDAPVAIEGETGTGKELIARAIHAASPRHARPFIPVNCSAITETLLESELFGYERGAFTGADRTTRGLFEAAGTGTLFLDEIGEISPRLQLALLRVLETGEIRPVGSTAPRNVRCRVITATNADLNALVGQGRFRQDLLYRLQRLLIAVPPLRERTEDIPLLVRHFLDEGRPVGVHARLSPELIDALRAYEWPGNVRELRNVVERMRLMHSDKLLYGLADLDLKIQPPAGAAPAAPGPGPAASPAPAATPIGDFLRQGRSAIRRLDRLRDLFREYRKLTRSEIVSILSVSPNTATKDLKQLCREGFVERVAPSASTRSHYFVLRD